MGKIEFDTNKGKMDAGQLIDALMYSSYEANRGYGMTHEQLVKIGVGNDAMRVKYDTERIAAMEKLLRDIAENAVHNGGSDYRLDEKWIAKIEELLKSE